jgi:hypothetical protein
MASVQMTAIAAAVSGKFGGVIFVNRKGDSGANYIKRYQPDVQNPRTVAQLRNRTIMACLNDLWKTLAAPQKAYWNGLTTGASTGWNAFCKYNMRQAQQDGMPQPRVNEQHLAAPPAPTALAATVVDNAVLITWTDNPAAFTSAIHLVADPAFPPAMSNLAYATPATPAENRQTLIRVAPGAYYVKARSAGEDGGTGAATAAVGPLVIT